MAANSTLLCIHRNPGQLSFLQDNGYELVTATSGRDGLQLFTSQAVDAVVIDYHLLNVDDAAIAAQIKQQRSTVPVVMIVDHMELPYMALESVDALVSHSDGDHFLLATLHFVLNVKPAQLQKPKLASQSAIRLPPSSGGQKAAANRGRNTRLSAVDTKDAPLSPRVWRNIRNGTDQF